MAKSKKASPAKPLTDNTAANYNKDESRWRRASSVLHNVLFGNSQRGSEDTKRFQFKKIFSKIQKEQPATEGACTSKAGLISNYDHTENFLQPSPVSTTKPACSIFGPTAIDNTDTCTDQSCMNVDNPIPTTTIPKVARIIIGKQRVSFSLPTEQLTNISGYFSKALSGNWKESSGEITMDEACLNSWRLFYAFAQTGRFESSAIDGPMLEEEKIEYEDFKGNFARANWEGITYGEIDMKLDRLIHAINFADYLQCPSFKNALMDDFLVQYERFVDDEQCVPLWNLDIVFELDSPITPLQQFVVDSLYHMLNEQTYKEALDNLITLETAGKIAAVAFQRKNKPLIVPWTRNRCAYHEHPPGKFFSMCDDGFSVHNANFLAVEDRDGTIRYVVPQRRSWDAYPDAEEPW
ncbi:hypothetical protein B7494_g4796 [Chlorociboria aeruginascens]|nr:hypothetical protein B7494_g4796 [Chlorociboria aeruginascens]